MVSQGYIDKLFRDRHNERQKKSAQKRRDANKKPKLKKEEKELLAWARHEKKLIESGKHGKLLLDKCNEIINKFRNRGKSTDVLS